MRPLVVLFITASTSDKVFHYLLSLTCLATAVLSQFFSQQGRLCHYHMISHWRSHYLCLLLTESTEMSLQHGGPQVSFNEFKLRKASFSSSRHCDRKSYNYSQCNPHVGINSCQLPLMQESEIHVGHIFWCQNFLTGCHVSEQCSR